MIKHNNNCIEVNIEKAILGFSYGKLILFIDKNQNLYLDTDFYHYSKTTSKHRNLILKSKIIKNVKEVKNLNDKLTINYKGD